MQYSDYMAQQERQAQLVAKYSDKPVHNTKKCLWAVTSVEKASGRVSYKEGVDVILAILVFGGIILAYCIFS